MAYLFKGLLILYTIVQMIMNSPVTSLEVAGLLIVVALSILREKYYNNPLILIPEYIAIFLIAQSNLYAVTLYAITTYDLVFFHRHYFLPVVILPGIVLLPTDRLPEYFFLLFISAFVGFMGKTLADKESSFKRTYDRERRFRYELEETKAKLLSSSKKAVHIAEIKERNRIARDIHDNVGHSITGILLQLQAAAKLLKKDKNKGEELLNKSIEGLADTVTLLRNTVHNIKPTEALGIEYIESIIDNFSFCPVEFSVSGDINSLSPDHIEVFSSNIKEALTNAGRYSKATKIEVRIDVNEHFSRLYIKDDGIGCEKIKEGLGISGMRERAKNMGGSFSVTSQDGFLIVCLLPREQGEGREIFENLNSG